MQDSFDIWEEKFIALCEEKLEEEPIYSYEHLYKKYRNPQKAFEAYLEENPDYSEKYEEMNLGNSLKSAESNQKEQLDFLALAKKLEEKRKLKSAEQKIANHVSKYCPECGRVLGSKKVCKCGYKVKK
jgi:RNA polymerase-binding transcription factor DksA